MIRPRLLPMVSIGKTCSVPKVLVPERTSARKGSEASDGVTLICSSTTPRRDIRDHAEETAFLSFNGDIAADRHILHRSRTIQLDLDSMGQ